MTDEAPCSRAARAAAERALIRVVHHYGARPEFVVIGGLVPELLCSGSEYQHAGTTDVDVQVDVEIACGSINTSRLEQALRNAEFEPDTERVWRWSAEGPSPRTIVKFELLADLDDVAAEATVNFDGCSQLGAVNLRGTGFACRDIEVRSLSTRVGGVEQRAEVNVSGLAGFLLAKCAAARSRRKPKDWYDIAFVLLHNDAGGPEDAAQAVLDRFGEESGTARTSLDDLLANFATPEAQGSQAYAAQMLVDHPELDRTTLVADAVVAVGTFHAAFTR
ncbi:MAG: nucleotidyl transferase AbiEii/AbiGii toxin family protein [Acidimicrobiia bacterium]|nr:nucleotidyl transferase AbiEii/AbiGii toxin family protein [Acidimicrobiia bacterium]